MIPSSSMKTIAALGWILVWAAAVAAEEIQYAKVGGDVTLKPKPGSVTDATTSITWKVGSDLAAELEDGDLTYYRDFKVRSELNNLTGDFTIKKLTYNDTKAYTIETSSSIPPHHKIDLRVISPVPVPTIASSCSEDKDAPKTCTLTCEGDTTRADPVEYSWMSDDTEVPNHADKTYTVKESSNVRKLSCKMKNPLGEEISKPFLNNLNTGQAEGGPKISTGITVAIILLVPLILVVIFHRWKTGEFFFNKNSMPWERDFWRNTKGQQPQAAALEANGATSTLKEQEEETAFNE